MLVKQTITLFLLVCLLSGCMRPAAPAQVSPSQVSPTIPTAPPPAVTSPTASNPFGIIINLNSPARLEMVKSLHLAYFRPSNAVFIDSWNGNCRQCQAAQEAGLKLVLTVRASGGGLRGASAPPADIQAYQQTLSKILDGLQPVILVVENEENSILFYTGTPQEYASELKAACQVAHAKNIPCTNGGIVSALVVLLTWENYFSQGDQTAACTFAQLTEVDLGDSRLSAADLCAAQSLQDLPEQVRQNLEKGKALLEVYRSADIDFMNFHWYITDPTALEQAATFLQTATGKPLMSNEMGQQNEDPGVVQPMLQKALDLGLSYVLWFSIDAIKSRALNNGAVLRPNGVAFQEFMLEHFK